LSGDLYIAYNINREPQADNSPVIVGIMIPAVVVAKCGLSSDEPSVSIEGALVDARNRELMVSILLIFSFFFVKKQIRL
jgi:hypothetical protein